MITVINPPTTSSAPGTTVVGSATIDFGAGGQRATVTVTGQASIATSSHVVAWLMGDTTADHSDYEHQMAAMVVDFACGNIVAGTGFDIVAVSSIQIHGQFKVHWLWA